MNLNKEIFRLSIPAIVSNITVPLLGLCDTAISGHLGAVSYLGAIAVGSMMVNPIFWLFGFLRMGTSGLTAQAFGAQKHSDTSKLFTQSVTLAVIIGTILLALRIPLGDMLGRIMAGESDITALACEYFQVVMWSAPALLGTMAVLGWMLGMQNTMRPMIVSIGVNAVNIILNIVLVYGFGIGFHGIAIATATANWTGFVTALLLARPLQKEGSLWGGLHALKQTKGIGRFFRVNTDILMRSACIMAVSMGMTAMASRLGALPLAVNAIMLQFFHTFSYFMDGLAFTGEALCGRFAGAGDKSMLQATVKRLLAFGAILAIAFMLLYSTGAGIAASLLTSQNEVSEMVAGYWYWLGAIPAVSVWAFVFDGIYIGLTATRRMLWSTLAASAIFFISGLLPLSSGLQVLWISFTAYLLTRGVVLAAFAPSTIRRAFQTHKLI